MKYYKESGRYLHETVLNELREAGCYGVIEPGVKIAFAENIEFGRDIYIGTNTILEAYHKNKMVIGDGAWIGAGCYFNSAGGLTIGKKVGIGPGVKILTSAHSGEPSGRAVIDTELEFNRVEIGDGADIGVGAIILPGVMIGEGAIIGAGSVIPGMKRILPGQIWAGNPCKYLGHR